jgi:hypothetical protein
MKKTTRTLISTLIALGLAIAAACATGTQNGNDRGNLNGGNANSSAPSPAANKPANKSAQAGGSIEVTSTPHGARVLLIANDEGGASEPQPRGVTPTTITGLSAGKYTVDLAIPGYRYYQKEVVVKENATVKVNAALRKQ